MAQHFLSQSMLYFYRVLIQACILAILMCNDTAALLSATSQVNIYRWPMLVSVAVFANLQAN